MENRADVETGVLTSDVGGGSSSGSPLPEWMKVLHRVPPRLREKKKHAYEPSVVSLGPLHHGRPHLLKLEEFKEKLVTFMLKEEDRRHLLHRKILERIDDVRQFYGGVSREEHGDEALASMMLRDGCLLLYHIEVNPAEKEEEAEVEKFMLVLRYLGLFQANLMASDCLKLENQIPWWVLTSLIGDHSRELIRRFLSFQTYGNFTQLKHLLWEQEDDDRQPLHLLEALRNTVILNPDDQSPYSNIDRLEEKISSTMDEAESTTDHLRSPPCPTFCGWTWRGIRQKSSPHAMLHPGRRPFCTVTEMRAKGVHLRPSSTFLLDIDFTSYYFFAVLRLPIMAVLKETEVLFSNMVALEMCPGTRCFDGIVTSYLTLMKSMIERAEDVKELQEKGILLSFVEDNGAIVRMLKEMDSSGVDPLPVYDEIKMKINHHCNSKARTWIADLVNTNFQSPWTAMALAAAALLLCLTFLQTYFTINPRA